MEVVPFITSEDEDPDLVVSFGLGPSASKSLTLIRTAEYESLLDEDERGVSVGTGARKGFERELLLVVRWKKGAVEIVTTKRAYILNITKVDAEEITEAKRIIKLMNFDSRFEIHDA